MSQLLKSENERQGVSLLKFEKIEYRIVPGSAYRIIRNCAGCREKREYESTGCFRVNANGNKLDIWLIYQCPKCKHTYNLTIYERLNRDVLEKADYQRFIENDEDTALTHGLNKSVFAQNKAEIANNSASYEIQILSRQEASTNIIVFHNPYGLKIRTENALAEVKNISRSKARKILSDDYPKYIGLEQQIDL